MDKKIYLIKVLEYLVKDKKIEIPDSLNDMRKLWSKLRSTEKCNDIPEEVLINEDKFLRLDLINRKLTDGEKLKTVDVTLDSKKKFANKIVLWQGDVTTIYADLLVNSTTSNVGDCSKDGKGSLDQAIFLRSGMRLGIKCHEIMGEKKLDVTEILITRAYNLPSDFIIHVVTPKIDGEPTEEDRVALKMCYANILECAKNNLAKVIVIPTIGVGYNKFPKEEAAKIAIEAVEMFLKDNNEVFDKIIFNVFDDDNFDIYSKLLIGEDNA